MAKRLLTVVGALVLLAASTTPFLLRSGDQFAGGLRTLLLELRGLDAALAASVMQLRLGLVENYDALYTGEREIDRRIDEFVVRSEDLGDGPGSRLRAAFEPFQAAVAERERALDLFPSDNATLNNSIRLLSAVYDRVRARSDSGGPAAGEASPRLDELYRRALQYLASPGEGRREALARALAAVEADASPGLELALVGHARIVLDQTKRVDDQVRRLVESKGATSLLETFEVFEQEARAASERRGRQRTLVTAACVLIVVLTCTGGVLVALRQNAALEFEVRERIRADREARKLEIELRQAQKLESIGQLAAGIAHEINTPVQFVSDSVHFVRDAWKDQADLVDHYRGLRRSVADGTASCAAAELLARAEEEADLEYVLENVPRALERSLEGLERVATIVRSLKEFAHPEQKEMVPADLNHAIQSTLTIARNEYKYVADVETDLATLPPVMCHVGEVNQVVLNIVVNAAHTIADKVRGSDAKGRIVVRTRPEADAVVISISDTGGGIPASIRERVFDPFFTTKEVGKGTGQGLAIARSVVVDKHGGRIWFETEVGAGTTFFIRLPLAGRTQDRSPQLEASA